MNIEICNYTKKLSKNLVLENINLSLCSQFVNCKNCYFALIKNIFIGRLVMQTHLKFLLCLYLFVHKIINRKMYPNESMPFICLEVNKRQTKCTRLPFLLVCTAAAFTQSLHFSCIYK